MNVAEQFDDFVKRDEAEAAALAEKAEQRATNLGLRPRDKDYLAQIAAERQKPIDELNALERSVNLTMLCDYELASQIKLTGTGPVYLHSDFSAQVIATREQAVARFKRLYAALHEFAHRDTPNHADLRRPTRAEASRILCDWALRSDAKARLHWARLASEIREYIRRIDAGEQFSFGDRFTGKGACA